MTNSDVTNEKTLALIKLERKQKQVEQLHLKLDSYRCAPKTHHLFEKKENLKAELSQFATTAEKLMETLKNLDITNNNYITDITKKFLEFNEIHREVEDYVSVVSY